MERKAKRKNIVITGKLFGCEGAELRKEVGTFFRKDVEVEIEVRKLGPKTVLAKLVSKGEKQEI